MIGKEQIKNRKRSSRLETISQPATRNSHIMIKSESEIKFLVERFQDGTLPEEWWTHEAHLTVACWFLINYTKDEATCYLRSGIIAYNAASGGKNTPASGYHETLTLFWIEIIHQFLEATEGDILTKINAFLESEFAEKDLFKKYYTLENLFTVKARARWLVPDLHPINILTETVL